MSDINNSHIHGDLTITNNVNNGEIGVINTNFIEETTTSVGITTNSSLKLKNDLKFFNNGIESVNLKLNENDIFSVENTAGNINLFSKGGKGVNIEQNTGNIIFTSTTDSVTDSTGSIITYGGVSIAKTLNIKENINALNGIHNFINTNTSENVIDIQNTSSGGSSLINFKDNLDNTKLEIGYGNSLSSLNDSYIQSKNGSNILIRANSIDSIKIFNDSSVEFFNTTSSTSTSNASIKFRGGISISNSTDSTSINSGGALTIGGGVSIQKQLYLGTTFNMTSISTPTLPNSGTFRFYIDNSDNVLKSIDSSGKNTVYQPTIEKGDLITHDGIKSINLPIGFNGEVLTVDTNTVSGLKWAQPKNKIDKYTLIGNTSKTNVIENYKGSFILLTYPFIEGGPSALFFSSKSYSSIGGVNVKFNGNNSIGENCILSPYYPEFKGVQIGKDKIDSDGGYAAISTAQFQQYNITLTNTNWSSINISETRGCYIIIVFNTCPCIFLISKADPLLNTCNIVRICSSPSINGTLMEIRWLSSGFPQIRKTSNFDNGIYKIKDIFSNIVTTTTVTLSGTSRSIISLEDIDFYQNRTIIVKITSVIENSPNGIFTISKNQVNRNSNKTMVRSPGKTTGEFLNIFWDSQNFIQVSKSGNSYDGIYDVSLMA